MPISPLCMPSGICLSALHNCPCRGMTFCYFIDAWIGAQAVLGAIQVTSCKSMLMITMDLRFLTWEIISRTLPTLDCVFLKAEAVRSLVGLG